MSDICNEKEYKVHTGGGRNGSTQLHGRGVEHESVTHAVKEEGDTAVRNLVITYLNRLSDWLFVAIRWIAMILGEDETLWVPLGKRNLD